jgi:hypothetical protein
MQLACKFLSFQTCLHQYSKSVKSGSDVYLEGRIWPSVYVIEVEYNKPKRTETSLRCPGSTAATSSDLLGATTQNYQLYYTSIPHLPGDASDIMASASGYNHHRYARAVLKKSRRWEPSLTIQLNHNNWKFEKSVSTSASITLHLLYATRNTCLLTLRQCCSPTMVP